MAEGTKHDDGKARWDLLPFGAMSRAVDVLTFGARKYAPNNWQKVPDARERYYAAALRYPTAWWGGEGLDRDSNLPHLAHAACCVLFLLAFDVGEVQR